MTKNKASDCIGDCRDKNMKNTEIKASGGGMNHIHFNYVQIRMNHEVQYYLFTAYHLSEENKINDGELFIFKINKEQLIPIIYKYGGYAHGTKTKNGEITLDDLNDKSNIKEYALRPTFNSECWKELLKYKINEIDLSM